MELTECYKKGLIKKTTINSALIKSLVEMAAIKKLSKISLSPQQVAGYSHEIFLVATDNFCLQEKIDIFSEPFKIIDFEGLKSAAASFGMFNPDFKIKEETVRNAQFNERNISAYASLAYDALRELLEALCIQSGHKVLSHDCIGEFLRESIKDFDYVIFDRVRYIGNGINYYGIRVGFGQGKEIINKIFALKKKMEGYLKK